MSERTAKRERYGRLLILWFIVACICQGCALRARDAQKPVNPNTSDAARVVLRYLYDLPSRTDKRVVSGHTIWDGYGGPLLDPSQLTVTPLDAIANRYGHWPGIISAEYTNWGVGTGPARPQRVLWRELNPILIDYWGRGGLVEIHFHPASFRNGELSDPGLDINDVLTPGGAYYANYMAELDEVVAGLSYLQQRVVVLWRPIHAAHNDNWYPFWWTGDPARYKRVWTHMFDYFKSKGLNNLLWMQSFNLTWPGKYPATSYFVGLNYVDLIGWEVPIGYQGAIPGQDEDQSYQFLTGLGKPIIISETGPYRSTDGSYDFMTIINIIRNRFPRVVAFIVFSTAAGFTDSPLSNSTGGKLLADPWVVNRGEIFLDTAGGH